MRNASRTTYLMPTETARGLHELATALRFERTRGRGSVLGQGNASAFLRSVVAAYRQNPALFCAALREVGVWGGEENDAPHNTPMTPTFFCANQGERPMSTVNYQRPKHVKKGETAQLEQDAAARQRRLLAVNELLKTIAGCGRKFFLHKGRVSYFELGEKGRIWFIDGYALDRIYPYGNSAWKGFSEGGTLRQMVVYLRGFILAGTPLPVGFLGPWPPDYCNGDLWGYGADMAKIRTQAQETGIATLPAI